MPRHKQNAPKGTLDVRVIRDGVFIDADVRKDAGDTALNVPEAVAKALIESGHVELL